MDKAIAVIAAAGAVCLSLFSCTVKEDRLPCPCWLQLEFDGSSRYGPQLDVKIWGNKEEFSEKYFLDDDPGVYEKAVQKGLLELAVYSGSEQPADGDGALTIPYGEQSDRIFAYCGNVNASDEFARDKVTLHKQYSVLTLYLDGLPTDGSISIGAALDGNSCGLSLKTMEVLRGPFHCNMEQDGRCWTAVIPRQADDSMMLEIILDGEPYKAFPVGEMIAASGFDWNATDLEDIEIRLDVTLATAAVTVGDWEPGGSKQHDI